MRIRFPILALVLPALLFAYTTVMRNAAAAAETVQSGRNAAEIASRLQHHYRETNSFSAKFVEKIMPVGAPPRERVGEIFFEKPGKLHWEFEGSQPETIVSNGTTIFDYDPELNQVIETPLKNAFRDQAAAAFILGAGNIEHEFKAAALPDETGNGLKHILLTPKAGGAPIEVGINPASSDIESITVKDSLGNQTRLVFSDIQRNMPLKASLFTFEPPAGADIVTPQAAKP